MTTPPTALQSAIARLTADDDSIYTAMVKAHCPRWQWFLPHEMASMRDSFRDTDRQAVLEHALPTLDPSPITAEGLKELGLKVEDDWWQIEVGKTRLSAYGCLPGFFWYVESHKEHSFSRDNVFPQPQTQGDLTTLLLRLERGDG